MWVSHRHPLQAYHGSVFNHHVKVLRSLGDALLDLAGNLLPRNEQQSVFAPDLLPQREQLLSVILGLCCALEPSGQKTCDRDVRLAHKDGLHGFVHD